MPPPLSLTGTAATDTTNLAGLAAFNPGSFTTTNASTPGPSASTTATPQQAQEDPYSRLLRMTAERQVAAEKQMYANAAQAVASAGSTNPLNSMNFAQQANPASSLLANVNHPNFSAALAAKLLGGAGGTGAGLTANASNTLPNSTATGVAGVSAVPAPVTSLGGSVTAGDSTVGQDGTSTTFANLGALERLSVLQAQAQAQAQASLQAAQQQQQQQQQQQAQQQDNASLLSDLLVALGGAGAAATANSTPAGMGAASAANQAQLFSAAAALGGMNNLTNPSAAAADPSATQSLFGLDNLTATSTNTAAATALTPSIYDLLARQQQQQQQQQLLTTALAAQQQQASSTANTTTMNALLGNSSVTPGASKGLTASFANTGAANDLHATPTNNANEASTMQDPSGMGGVNDSSASGSKKRRYASTQEEKWNRMFARLADYKQQKGDCLVPFCYKPDRRLGWWVQLQRQNQSKLTPERKQMLDSLQFVWKVRSKEQWHDMFLRLKEYREAKGNCLVPQRYKQDPKLGKWVHYQRAAQNQLPQSRREALDGIDFVWNLQQEKLRKAAAAAAASSVTSNKDVVTEQV
eukprot:CAMPEP_0195283492 /NCGR_PEP_ID=MMETSP0707-20130614/2015_1 /TAXON_ID=33640 /ORGANISM="Asterionellopsis glacialis, Strain CCMP134" /LENGTH=581 /DNA_ID=CAMNT_0040342667 /DNA_START=73 /DNA_END=1818 /DNA_ORIENTATION=-